LKTVERQGRLRPDDGGFGRQSRRRKDGHDQRDLSEGASHSNRFGRRKGGAVARSVAPGGGMNAKLHAIRRTAKVGRSARSSSPSRSAIAGLPKRPGFTHEKSRRWPPSGAAQRPDGDATTG